jgi:hypothetical protein
MMPLLAAIVFIFAGSPVFANTMSEKEKINYLLEAVSTSGVTFIRNDTKYSGAEAKAHLELKLRNAGSRIQTADDFITYLASKSSLSGIAVFHPAGRWQQDNVRKMAARQAGGDSR